MNAAELHLLINHLPVLGSVFACVLLITGRVARNDVVTRTGLFTMIFAALAGGGVFLSGEPAEHFVEKLAGYSESHVEAHEDAGKIAAIALGLAGLVAAIALLRYRRTPVPGGVSVIVLLSALIAAGFVGWTAYLGGQIRHTELRPDFETVPAGSAEVGDDG